MINFNADQSKPWWPPRVVPPKGAPNVLLIMTDDVGFGAPSTFGGVDPHASSGPHRQNWPALHAVPLHRPLLADPGGADHRPQPSLGGLRRCHRTIHRLPGLQQHYWPDSATIGEILKQNGYSTSWFGKDHNTPDFQASQIGPFDQWPTGMGFEYFYGFVGGDTSQWQPNLFRNTTAIYPYVGKPKWNLTTAMADEAIHWLKQLNDIDPDKPFFCYYVPGGTHAPHHPTPEWTTKFKGKFDMGWNALARADLRQSEAARRDPAGCQAYPLARKAAAAVGNPERRPEEDCSLGRRRSMRPTWPTPITKSAA